ncbi:UDP-N-acetylglucosamine--undecaprenyl-phosphate N-acetylglucosaminephosphotransferase [uncultured Shewanella sp.]|uniref:UDP-N-acetylglucosamine--undecaprenyl-phosphate N-acetylglucosaminephosphotransferase n=1 Tax=uncultured Shewanella sp. TaxID=173975 RepID=UPI002607EB84|nr:UDP-N-acetylglucosamine--undecaprenyl-phosphate N-acetylglucosaminephosphotransferase [uncultured Shewanella sp.]
MEYIIPLLSTFLISFFAIKLMKPIAVKTGLVDTPNVRKKHVGSIPLIGGISIFIGVFFTALFFIEPNDALKIYLSSIAMILILGVFDDMYDLSVKLRIGVQILVASLMIFGADFYLHSFGSVLGFFELELGYLGVVITILAVIGSINAFNMVDGIDGLAGMLSLVSFSSLLFLLWRVESSWHLVPLLFIAALLAYLIFNLGWPSKSLTKIFMGDAGSMLIGLTVVWLLVIGATPNLGAHTQAFRPVTALYLIAIPLMDMAAIMYRRIKKGVSPFKPDREHLHHIFERAGYNRKQTLVIITSFASLIAMIGCISELYLVPEWIMFVGFIVLFLTYNYALMHVWKILTFIRR